MRLTPLAALLALVVTSPAVATHTACRPLLTDARADDHGLPEDLRPVGGGAGRDPALDVVSADLVSNAKNVTAVIRTRDFPPIGAQTSVGRIWRLYWTVPVNEQRYWLEAVQATNGANGWVGRVQPPWDAYDPDTAGSGPFARADVSFNPDANEVRITAPVKAFDEYVSIKPRTKMYDVAAGSFKHYGVAASDTSVPPGSGPQIARIMMGSTGEEHPADDAKTSRVYYAGAKACVKA